MKQKILLLLFFILLLVKVYAQKEAYNWFMGQSAGLTWNTTRSFSATGTFGTTSTTLYGLPTEIVGSSINTMEGCYSLSDSEGNLLFYSDGMTIWNRKHAVMQNGSGMGGHNSSAQSGIIVPYPGNSNKYISASIGMKNANNLAYSIIDMDKSTNGGYEDGAVVTKNIYFTGFSGTLGETMTTIKHANRINYWMVAPGRGAKCYLNAWLVNSAGIQHTSPVITEITGLSLTATNDGGYIKFSPDGKHFAWAAAQGGKLIFGDFDSLTGLFSNIKSVNISAPSGHGPYGIEFTVSGKYLYMTNAMFGNSEIRVYDFEELLAAADPSTVAYISHPGIYAHGAVQLGPDGRIYINYSHLNNRYIYVVENPEEYSSLKFYLLSNFLSSGYFQAGLPSFSASWWSWNISNIETEPILPVCKDTEITFTVTVNTTGVNEIAYIEWNFGDSSVIEKDENTSQTTFIRKHNYVNPGTYALTITPYDILGEAITDKIKTTEVIISRCVMPVNPNVHFWK